MIVSSQYLMEMQFAGTAGAWTDVTADVVQVAGIHGEQGINGVAPTDRVASSGVLSFSMNNSATNSAALIGYYSPGHTNCRVGFQAGITVRLSIVYDGSPHIEFYGRIPSDGIKIDTGLYGTRRTMVEVRDFMELAAIHNMYLPEFTENLRIDEIVPLVVANMPIQPLSATYNTGSDTFTTVFDTTREKTKALQELQKVAMSELGFIYVRPDGLDNEELVVEGRMTRTNTPALSDRPLESALSGFMLNETGGYMLREDGGKMILNEVVAINIDNLQTKMEVVNGANLVNIVKGISYPRRIDTAATVLFTLNNAIELAAGETKTGYAISYKDPLNLAQGVAGKDMVTPAATVDYLMNSDRSGTVTNMTSSLSVGVTYGVSGALYNFTNAGTVTGYITKLTARGKGIYTYEPVTYVKEDAASQLIHGSQSIDLDLKYQDNPAVAEGYTNIVLTQYKDPVTEAQTVTYIANSGEDRMGAFLMGKIGSKVRLCEDVSGVDAEYFIHKKSFDIHPGNIIEYTWTVKRASVDIYHFWYLETVGSGELGVTTYIGF